MIYLLAAILGFVTCIMSFVSEITAGNICHLKNGRQPNAGAALFPTLPVIPFLVIGAAWLLRTFIPTHAILLLAGSFLIFVCIRAVSFVRLRGQIHRLIASRSDQNQLGVESQ